MKTLIIAVILVLFAAWLAAICPGVYGYLPVSAQITIYGWRLRVLPFPSETARSEIAHHAGEAAELLAADLACQRPTLLPSESAYILAIIQHRGTSLRNSNAERSLRQFLASERATRADVIAGQFALDAIEKDVRLPPSLQPR